MGQTTGVDTGYMENRGWPLPSGLTVVGYPMKVYRDRRRANNAAYPPDVRRDDLADQEDVRRWVLAHYREWRPRR